MSNQFVADAFDQQYRAALKMLRNAIEKCPDELWNARDGNEAPVWQQALHVIFYARLYLLASLSDGAENSTVTMALIGEELKDFSESELKRLGMMMWSLTRGDFMPKRTPTKEELLARIDKVDESLASATRDLAAGRGADDTPIPWVAGSRFNLLLYNLRHVQHHVGRLNGTLGRRGVKLEWY